MIHRTLRFTPSFQRCAQAVLAAAALAGSAGAFAQAGQVYGGFGAGFGIAARPCGDAPVCNRATFSQKLFGGVRMTPTLAAEVNYFYFRGADKANDAAGILATGVATQRDSTRTTTLGINWETELLMNFTNHIRLGWAFSKHKQVVTNGAGVMSTTNNYSGSPYLGLGLSYEVQRGLHLNTGYDFIIDGHDSNHMLSVGATLEL